MHLQDQNKIIPLNCLNKCGHHPNIVKKIHYKHL